MSVSTKQFVAIVSNAAGNILTTWPAFAFQGFSKSLNVGLGECVIQVPLPFNYEGADLEIGNDVEIRVSDRDTMARTDGPTSRTIYKGYISLIERQAVGADETVTVHLLGYATQLAVDILKNAAQTTLYSYASGLTVTAGSLAACDIGLLARSVIDRYRAETTLPKINYDAAKMPNTGTTVIYSFEQRTYQDALNQCRQMAPAGTFFYIGEDGMVIFGQKPAAVTHRFVMGKHFNQIKLSKSIENVRNAILVWNGEPTSGGMQIYKGYSDADSILKYGRRVATVNDYGVSDAGGAALIGAKFIAESKDAEITLQLIVLDNNNSDNFGYDIESIQPGDTCNLSGFAVTFGNMLRDNMLITDVQYEIGKATITVEVVKSGLIDLQSEQGKNLNNAQTGGLKVPESYT